MAGIEKSKVLLPWLIIIGLWAALHGALAVTVASPVFEGQLHGPDEYMRLVRVAELRDGNGWYDTAIARSNAPYGEVLHWTRPMDLLILPGAYALAPFFGADDALFASGALISPLLGLLTCLAMAWAVSPILGRNRAILAAIIVLIQPGVLAYGAAGRADHHGLLFLLFVLAIGSTVRMLSARQTARSAVIAGIVYGLAIWEGIEMTILVALCQAAAALAWICFDTVKARPQLIAAAAFLATTALALASEHPPEAIFAVEFDRVALPHLVIATLTCAVWSAASAMERFGTATPLQRGAVMAAAGGVGVLILLSAFPDIVAGPYAAMDPRLLSIWDAHIAELGSLAPTDLHRAGQFLFFIGAVVPSLVYGAITAWRHRSDPRALPWMFLTLLATAYFLLSLQHLRMAPFAELTSVPVLAAMIGGLASWSERRLARLPGLLVTCCGVFALAFGGVIAGTYLLSLSASASAKAPEPACRIARIAPLLNDPTAFGATPLVVAALLDRGPEILYRTRHSVVGTPYHRNAAGIWDSYRLLAAPAEEESHEIAVRRGIDLLLVCPSRVERTFYTRQTGRDNLYTRMSDGDVPPWLAPVAISPKNADGFRLYRVIR
jgi:hypothetical protein